MRSTIVIFVLVFAVLGLLLGFAESFDSQSLKLAAYTPPAIYPSVSMDVNTVSLEDAASMDDSNAAIATGRSSSGQ